jgi:hypothetical protein
MFIKNVYEFFLKGSSQKNDIVKQKGANNHLFSLEFIVLINFWQVDVTRIGLSIF